MHKYTIRFFTLLLAATLSGLLLYLCLIIPTPIKAANHSSQSWKSQPQGPLADLPTYYTVTIKTDENDLAKFNISGWNIYYV